MTSELHPFVWELLTSHICHDLISPVSAINNGAELIEECGPEMMTEAMALITDSGQQAARHLSMFRLAYGAGHLALDKMDVLRKTIEDYYQRSKIKVRWLIDHLPAEEGLARLLSLTAMLASEILPYGGVCQIQQEEAKFTFIFEGEKAALKPESLAAFIGETPISDLTPRTVHAYLTGWYAKYYNWILEWDNNHEKILKLTLNK